MSPDSAPSRRAQSSLLGVTVLLGIVLVVSVALVVGGSSVVEESRDTTTVESASMSMTQLKSEITELHNTPGTTRQMRFQQVSGSDDSLRVEDEGAIRVIVNDTTTDDEALNESRDLGQLVYQNGDEIIAYQGGGIWRSSVGSTDSAVLSDPNFEYSGGGPNPTLSIPIVQVRGSASGDDIRLVQPDDAESLFPSATGSNPLDTRDTVTIAVTSQFYRGWGAYFERSTNADVTYDHGEQTASVEFHGPAPSLPRPVPGAITSSGADRLNVYNDVQLDGYDGSQGGSSNGDAPVYVRGIYDASNGVQVDGDVVAGDRVEIEGDDSGPGYHVVDGDVVSGGTHTDADPSDVTNRVRITGDFSTRDDLAVEGSNSGAAIFEGDVYVFGDLGKFTNVRVDGNVYVQGAINAGGSNAEIDGDVIAGNGISGSFQSNAVVQGTTDQAGDPPEPETPDLPEHEPIDDLLDERKQAIANDNDNGDVSDFDQISNHEYCQPKCTLTAGEYHFQDSLYLYDEKLVLDTRQGPIDIYAQDGTFDGVTIQSGSNVTVLGDNPVTIYTDGNVAMYGSDSKIVTRPAPHRAANVRIFVDPSKGFEMASGIPELTGAIYGSGESQNATVRFTNDAVVHGAVVGKMETIDVRVQMHFDRELLPQDGSDANSRVEYVRVSTRSVEVSG